MNKIELWKMAIDSGLCDPDLSSENKLCTEEAVERFAVIVIKKVVDEYDAVSNMFDRMRKSKRGKMHRWKINLVTNDFFGNSIELMADTVIKVNYQTLVIDGEKWELPEICGLSFADVEIDDEGA